MAFYISKTKLILTICYKVNGVKINTKRVKTMPKFQQTNDTFAFSHDNLTHWDFMY